MTNSVLDIRVQDIDHLGIVAGIINEMGLMEQINQLLGTHPQGMLSLGQVVKAMILNGLGLVSAPLYLFERFFGGKATEHLLGEGYKSGIPERRPLGQSVRQTILSSGTHTSICDGSNGGRSQIWSETGQLTPRFQFVSSAWRVCCFWCSTHRGTKNNRNNLRLF